MSVTPENSLNATQGIAEANIDINAVIASAIKCCEEKIHSFPDRILSESDFERMLVNEIEDILPSNSGWVVHTQVSFYSSGFICQTETESGAIEKCDVSETERMHWVDIILMKSTEIEDNRKDNKGFFIKVKHMLLR